MGNSKKYYQETKIVLKQNVVENFNGNIGRQSKATYFKHKQKWVKYKKNGVAQLG